MAIDALYKSYFQKSKVFLYPLLGIKLGSPVVPEQTYLSWDGYLTPEDIKLIAIYPKRTDQVHKNFEKTVILKHERLCDYVELNDTQNLLTFDYNDLKDDYQKMADGKYSQMDPQIKRKILNHFDKTNGSYTYMESYLFPERFFSLYASLLGVDESFLRSVGELCSKPDLEKENLIATVSNLENKKILG
jgi:hypothetical protein